MSGLRMRSLGSRGLVSIVILSFIAIQQVGAERSYYFDVSGPLSTYQLSKLSSLVDSLEYDHTNEVAHARCSETGLKEVSKKGFYVHNAIVLPDPPNRRDPGITDSDGDGMDDDWEVAKFGDLSRDGNDDMDAVGPASTPGNPIPGPDGLTDLWEYRWGTNPDHWDSDSDVVGDGEEIDLLRSGDYSHGPPFAGWPSTDDDRDGDCIPDVVEELLLGFNANRESTDGDKYDDGQEFFGITEIGRGGMPRAVDSDYLSSAMPNWVDPPGSHWLVAAYPDIHVELLEDTITIVKRAEIQSGQKSITETERTRSVRTDTYSESYNRTKSYYGPKYSSRGKQDRQENRPSQVVGQSVSSPPASQDVSSDAVMCTEEQTPSKSMLERVCTLVGAVGSPEELAALDYQAEVDSIKKEQKVNKVISGLSSVGSVLIETGLTVAKATGGIAAKPAAVIGGVGLVLGAVGEAADGLVEYDTARLDLIQNGSNIDVKKCDSRLSLASIIVPGLKPALGFIEKINDSKAVTVVKRKSKRVTVTSTSRYFKRDEWWEATSSDTEHAADVRFSLVIRNSGTDVSREISSILVNAYLGEDENPFQTINLLADSGLGVVQNLFPGQEIIVASPIDVKLTLDELRRIDLGAPVHLVVERIEYGDDQIFYEDAFAGGVMFLVDDGVADGEEELDEYLIPTWGVETYQDVLGRADPIIQLEASGDGHIYQLSVPQYDEQHQVESNSTLTVGELGRWRFLTQTRHPVPPPFRDIESSPETMVILEYDEDSDRDGYSDRQELRRQYDPNDAASHPEANLQVAYIESVDSTGTNYSWQIIVENLGDDSAEGLYLSMYAPDRSVKVHENLVGINSTFMPGDRVVFGPTFDADHDSWAGSSIPIPVGSYSGTQDVLYVFSANDDGNVGWSTGGLQISWFDDLGNAGSFDVGSGYAAPSAVEVTNGLYLRFYSGTSNGASSGFVNAGDTLQVQAETARDVFRFSTVDPTNYTPPRVIASYNTAQGNYRKIVDTKVYHPETSFESLDYRMRPPSPAPRISVNALSQVDTLGSNTIAVKLYNPDITISNAQVLLEYTDATGSVVHAFAVTNDLQPGESSMVTWFEGVLYTNLLHEGEEFNLLLTLADEEGALIDSHAHLLTYGFNTNEVSVGGELELPITSIELVATSVSESVSSEIFIANTGTNYLQFTVFATNSGLIIGLPNSSIGLAPGESTSIGILASPGLLGSGASTQSVQIVSSDPQVGSTMVQVAIPAIAVETNIFTIVDVPSRPWRRTIVFNTNLNASTRLNFVHYLGDDQFVIPQYAYSDLGGVEIWGDVITNKDHVSLSPGSLLANKTNAQLTEVVLNRDYRLGEALTIVYGKGIFSSELPNQTNIPFTISTTITNIEGIKAAVTAQQVPLYRYFDQEPGDGTNTFDLKWDFDSFSGYYTNEDEYILVKEYSNGREYSTSEAFSTNHSLLKFHYYAGSGWCAKEIYFRWNGVIFDTIRWCDQVRKYTYSLPQDPTAGVFSAQYDYDLIESEYYSLYLDAIPGVKVAEFRPTTYLGLSSLSNTVLYSYAFDGSLEESISLDADPDLPVWFSNQYAKIDLIGTINTLTPETWPYAIKYFLISDPEILEVSQNHPDLTISNLSAGVTGRLLNVGMYISNDGESSVSNFTLNIFNGNPAELATFVGSILIGSTLDTNESLLASIQFTNVNLTAWDAVYAWVDPYDYLVEMDENNNTASNLVVMPDYILNSLEVVREVSPGVYTDHEHPYEDVPGYFSVVVSNAGSVAQSGTVELLATNPVRNISYFTNHSISLVPGGLTNVILPWNEVKRGNYQVTGVADPDDLVIEMFETNNQLVINPVVSLDEEYVDAGHSSEDLSYSLTNAHGYLNGVARDDWGSGTVTAALETVRYGLGGTVDYQYDWLDPFYTYQMDFSIYRGDSGTSSFRIAVNGSNIPAYIESGSFEDVISINETNSHLVYGTAFFPSSLIKGYTITATVQRVDSAGPSYLSQIQVSRVDGIYIDCGATNDWAYDPGTNSYGHLNDGFAFIPSNETAVTSIRYDYDGSVDYHVDGLITTNRYLLHVQLWEDDNVGRQQQILTDGLVCADPIVLSSGVVEDVLCLIPSTALADGQVDISVQSINGSDVQVSTIQVVDWTLNRLLSEDSDGDRMPDVYEHRHNSSTNGGVTPLDSEVPDAQQDADGDGVDNLTEYLSGTDPLDASSALEITSIVTNGNENVLVEWKTVGYREYILHHSEEHENEAWQPVGSATQVLSTGTATWPTTNNGPDSIFRIEVLPK